MKIAKITLNQISALLIFYCTTALGAAYIAQYFFNLQPCILCLYQRIPFFAVIFIAIFALFFKQEKSKKIAIFVCALFLIANTGLAFYHVGVEKKIFHMTEKCTSDINESISITQLEESLKTQPLTKCDEPQFIFLGMSMALWNAIYCIILAVSTVFLYFNRQEP